MKRILRLYFEYVVTAIASAVIAALIIVLLAAPLYIALALAGAILLIGVETLVLRARSAHVYRVVADLVTSLATILVGSEDHLPRRSGTS